MFLRNWARLYSNLTLAERTLEKSIAQRGEAYRSQHPFFGMRRIVDFALLDRKIIIEVDGPSHELSVQRRKDLTSTIAFEKQGWRVVRVTNAEVLENPDRAYDLAMERLNHRPSILELEAALVLLPESAVRLPRRRAQKPTRPRAKGKKPLPGA